MTGWHGSDLSQTLAAHPQVKLPALVNTAALEDQGLVAHASDGFSFCKNWDSKTMCLFFEQHLPRPFQYFKEQGFDGKNPSKLPFCILKREDRTYVVVKPPANGPTGKFYQDNAMGPAGGSYKNRKIVLGQYSQASGLVVPIFMHPQVSKRPIPQDILNEWNRRPVLTENGPSGREPNTERDQPVQGSSKMQPRPKKKGSSCHGISPAFADHQK